eukprot:368328-Prymnesium_polylepis.3
MPYVALRRLSLKRSQSRTERSLADSDRQSSAESRREASCRGSTGARTVVAVRSEDGIATRGRLGAVAEEWGDHQLPDATRRTNDPRRYGDASRTVRVV